MIKIENNTATREPLPQFLVGLKPESLLDLSWTDPQLGVQGCAWWPEEDASQPLPDALHKYGAETLTVDTARKVVTVVRAIEPLSEGELAALIAASNAVVLEKIEALERTSLLNRGSREMQLFQLEERAAQVASENNVAVEMVLATNIYYGKLKALDDEAKALRDQLS